METYLQSSAHKFSEKYPKFWEVLSSYKFDENEFEYLSKIVIENIANFGKEGLKTISYVFKLYMELSVNNELDLLMRFHKTIQKECEKSFVKADMLHNSIVKIIDPMFTYNDIEYNHPNCLYKRIKCPYEKYYKNEYADLTEEYPFMYYFIDLKNSVQRGHYYVMSYVYYLTLRMQKIKSEIIKYELSRNGKPSGTIIDILIDENYMYYMNLNNEFIKYNKLMNSFNYYGSNIGLNNETKQNLFCPNNNDLMNMYFIPQNLESYY